MNIDAVNIDAVNIDAASIEALFLLTPGFLAFTLAVGLFGFVVSSTFGIGGGILLIPVLALRIPAAQAVALSAPIMLVNNVLKTWVYRRSIHLRALWLVSILSLPAAFVGALVTARMDDRLLLLALAVLIFATLWLERVRARPVRISDKGLLGWGLVTGAISGLCGAAGPPTAIGLRGYGLERETFVGTVAIFAVLLQVVKMPAYFEADLLPVQLWPLGGLLSTTAVVGAAVAPALLRRLPGRIFQLAVDGILLISAVWILVDVVRRSL